MRSSHIVIGIVVIIIVIGGIFMLSGSREDTSGQPSPHALDQSQ
ncbi:hypothetical protein [Oryzifoliimicrobium ureilyticus]